ncbi:MAG: hypothetical protein DCC75_07125, partial [Proteobacteria bacterium]
MTALLLLIVAAIDVSRLYNSQTELERTAQAACLGALEQFLVDRGINNQVRDRLSAAVKRAEAMVGINVALSIGNLSGRSNDLQDALGFPEDGGEEANGMLELGRWRYEDPKLPQGQPSCWYDQGVNPRPCFD